MYQQMNIFKSLFGYDFQLNIFSRDCAPIKQDGVWHNLHFKCVIIGQGYPHSHGILTKNQRQTVNHQLSHPTQPSSLYNRTHHPANILMDSQMAENLCLHLKTGVPTSAHISSLPSETAFAHITYHAHKTG